MGITGSHRYFLMKFFTWIFTVLWVYQSSAVSAESSEDFQLWLVPTVTAPITDDRSFSLYFESQVRGGDDVSYVERLLIRPALVYNHTKSLSFSLGYGWTPTYLDNQYNRTFSDEHRLWQQLTYSHAIEEFQIVHRLREEQRFIEGLPQVSNRFRYLVRASKPLADSGLGATVYNELFINLHSIEPGPDAGFDRDRVFVGSYLIDGVVRYEVGYLGEYARRFRSGEGRLINALALAASVNF